MSPNFVMLPKLFRTSQARAYCKQYNQAISKEIAGIAKDESFTISLTARFALPKSTQISPVMTAFHKFRPVIKTAIHKRIGSFI